MNKGLSTPQLEAWMLSSPPPLHPHNPPPQPGSGGPAGSFSGSGLGFGEWRPLGLLPEAYSAHPFLWEAEDSAWYSWYPINTCWMKIALWKGTLEAVSVWTYEASETLFGSISTHLLGKTDTRTKA